MMVRDNRGAGGGGVAAGRLLLLGRTGVLALEKEIGVADLDDGVPG